MVEQGALLADLESRVGKGIEGYKSYWLINAVLVVGDVDAVRAVAARADRAVDWRPLTGITAVDQLLHESQEACLYYRGLVTGRLPALPDRPSR